mmetsp:Transcript_95215/g.269098  ORF Transcript_95215/g.269098 Transcript_95215/m.269098 type:complete len:383 (-) Transcript_95215:93-1241(-)
MQPISAPLRGAAIGSEGLRLSERDVRRLCCASPARLEGSWNRMGATAISRLPAFAAASVGLAAATTTAASGGARRRCIPRRLRRQASLRRHGVLRRAMAREPQVIPFAEPGTRAEVVLVGCMHFNPRSVQKATTVANQLAEQGELFAVVVESCPTRWAKVREMQPAGSPLRALLDNEMQAAAEVAEANGRPVVLGDQRFEELRAEVSEFSQVALNDLASPFDGGWQRTATDIVEGLAGLLGNVRRKMSRGEPSDNGEAFGLVDFLDPLLFLGAPVAITRYFLSMSLRVPLLVAGVVGVLIVLALLPDSWGSDVVNLVFNVLFLRVFLKALLRDRDVILADSIRDACAQATRDGPGRTVVAILGAAHCNGVRRHLLEGASPAK